MAIITPALLATLNTAIRRSFSDKYEAMRAETFWSSVATLIPSTTASNTYAWLNDFPELREWIGARVIKDMAVTSYQITNRLFESTVSVQRTQIEDDQYGHYGLRAMHMAQKAAEHPDRIVADIMRGGEANLCYDGQNYFDTDHPVYPNVDGTGIATTWSNYDAAPRIRPGLVSARHARRPQAVHFPGTDQARA